ncbi:GtrA family protein [Aristophania vespae]|uniref:GtrA family protein n=1 Tax=Aristophania vespae TaxID=2697033 RepID=UPI0038D0609E|nr:hypothetical protein DM15PD_15920 [Aristophania vespae]
MNWAFLTEFFRFGLVGTTGLLIDWLTLNLCLEFSPFHIAVLCAYFTSASWNWCLNRIWTFRKSSRDSQKPAFQWVRFILANIPVFFINRGITLILHHYVPHMRNETLLILFCGALGGMIANFLLTRRCVFFATNKP